MCEVPLTMEEKLFAAENHGLVNKFLRENHLPEDEFYDIIIFGYLRSVCRYFSEPELNNYSFATIAWKGMQGCLSNYRRGQKSRKRNAEVISIHLIPHEGVLPLEETLSKPDELMLQLETELLLHDLAKHISRNQMDMVRLKSGGYGIREIARSKKVTMKQVKETLENVRLILTELCQE